MIRLLRAYRKYEGRFLLQFVLLVLTMFLLPYAQGHRALMTILFLAIPLAGVYAASYNRRALVIAIILVIPAIVTGTALNLDTQLFAVWLSYLSAVAFYGFTTTVVLTYVLRQKTITADTIYGALSVYLLLGMTWAFAFAAVDNFSPGSFFIDTAYNPDGMLGQVDFFYYSFVTLTTLGYGDILPLTAQARMLAVLEAVCGVLFTATLIASLMGRLRYRSDVEGDGAG